MIEFIFSSILTLFSNLPNGAVAYANRRKYGSER